MQLDHSSVVPLYRQLKEILIQKINSGELKPGDQLPTEPEMCDTYEVSRITVRKAILELVDEQCLVRKQGKGTFVAKRIENGNIINASFTETYGSYGYSVRNKLLSVSEITAEEDDIKYLGAEHGDSIVLLERLRYLDDKPVRVEMTFFGPRYGAVINEDFEGRSVFNTIRNRYGIYNLRQKSRVGIVLADEKLSRLLGVARGEPLLNMFSVVYDELGNPIFRTQLYQDSKDVPLYV